MGGAHHCSAPPPHLRNDLYCVERDVKLYYTIPFLIEKKLLALTYRLDEFLVLHFNGHFPGGPGSAGTRMSVLDCIRAMGDGGGGDSWTYKMCKAPGHVLSSTNQHPFFYRLDKFKNAKKIFSHSFVSLQARHSCPLRLWLLNSPLIIQC